MRTQYEELKGRRGVVGGAGVAGVSADGGHPAGVTDGVGGVGGVDGVDGVGLLGERVGGEGWGRGLGKAEEVKSRRWARDDTQEVHCARHSCADCGQTSRLRTGRVYSLLTLQFICQVATHLRAGVDRSHISLLTAISTPATHSHAPRPKPPLSPIRTSPRTRDQQQAHLGLQILARVQQQLIQLAALHGALRIRLRRPTQPIGRPLIGRRGVVLFLHLRWWRLLLLLLLLLLVLKRDLLQPQLLWVQHGVPAHAPRIVGSDAAGGDRWRRRGPAAVAGGLAVEQHEGGVGVAEPPVGPLLALFVVINAVGGGLRLGDAEEGQELGGCVGGGGGSCVW